MNATVLSSIYTLLHDDSALQGLLGAGVERVFTGWRTDDMVVPCLTLTENTEGSDLRVGYGISRHRDATPTIQLDYWTSLDSEGAPTTEVEVGPICDRIDELLFKPGNVANTRSWRRSSTSPLSPDPDQPHDLHKALRYSFAYGATDS
jgi:hypothetical protein